MSDIIFFLQLTECILMIFTKKRTLMIFIHTQCSSFVRMLLEFTTLCPAPVIKNVFVVRKMAARVSLCKCLVGYFYLISLHRIINHIADDHSKYIIILSLLCVWLLMI